MCLSSSAAAPPPPPPPLYRVFTVVYLKKHVFRVADSVVTICGTCDVIFHDKHCVLLT